MCPSITVVHIFIISLDSLYWGNSGQEEKNSPHISGDLKALHNGRKDTSNPNMKLTKCHRSHTVSRCEKGEQSSSLPGWFLNLQVFLPFSSAVVFHYSQDWVKDKISPDWPVFREGMLIYDT